MDSNITKFSGFSGTGASMTLDLQSGRFSVDSNQDVYFYIQSKDVFFPEVHSLRSEQGLSSPSTSGHVATQFRILAETWKRETKGQSAVSAIVMHPAYLDIIGMGPAAVKPILQELQRENNHWFTALRALTKASPVKPEQAGNLNKMRQAWLQWGKDNGFLA